MSTRRERLDRDCRQTALDLLARRDYARRELLQKLKRRFTIAEVDAALDELAAAGLQCDYRYACGYARERVRRGYGPLRIRGELQQRGVSAAIVADALADTERLEGWNWGELARGALRRKYGSSRLPRELPQRAKVLRYLQYRGFPTLALDDDDDAVAQDA